MNLDHDFFQVSKLSEERKKGLHLKWNTIFPRIQVKTKIKKVFTKNGTLVFPEFKWRPALRCTPESIIRGDEDVDHTQIIGGGYSQIIGSIYPPRVSALLHEQWFLQHQ